MEIETIPVPTNATMAEIEKKVLHYYITETSKTTQEIATTLGIDYRTVYRKLQAYGLPRRVPYWPQRLRKRTNKIETTREQSGLRGNQDG